MRILSLLLLLFLFSCKSVKNVSHISAIRDSISVSSMQDKTEYYIDRSKALNVETGFANEIVIEYKQDSVTKLPIVVKKTVRSRGVKKITMQNNNTSSGSHLITSVDSHRTTSVIEAATKEVQRSNYSFIPVILVIVIAILITLKIIKR